MDLSGHRVQFKKKVAQPFITGCFHFSVCDDSGSGRTLNRLIFNLFARAKFAKEREAKIILRGRHKAAEQTAPRTPACLPSRFPARVYYVLCGSSLFHCQVR
jgi:hypothetical protein